MIKIEKHIKKLIKKASKAESSDEARQYAETAVQLANIYSVIKHLKGK